MPIIIELLLNSLMGMADTMMASTIGSGAMSAVALIFSARFVGGKWIHDEMDMAAQK